MFDFRGQLAVVTGGTRGIGRAIVEAFLEAGARVVATYVSRDSEAEAFRASLAGRGFSELLHLKKFDTSDYASVEKFYHELENEHGILSILVNNAGIRRDSIVGMMKPEDWKAVLDANLTGTFNMSKFAVLAMMRKRYGRIINITSPSGKFGFEGQANYAASKAGQVAFTRSLSREVATRGITVNCVSPGFIDTDFIRDLPAEQKKAYEKQVPLRRFGQPSEVAFAVLFLASPGASYITGTTLEVTGGL